MSELLYGIHPVHEALRAGRRRFQKLYISKRRTAKGVQEILKHAEAAGIPVEYREADYFGSLFGKAVHQGVAARTSGYPFQEISAILRKAEAHGQQPVVLAVDGVLDPQNMGSLIRTAVSMSIHGVILPKDRSSPLTPAVSKASAGAMEHALIARVANLVAALKGLKKGGLWVAGADANAGQRIDETDLRVGLVLVVGGEQKGIRSLVRKTCDYLVSVPQDKIIGSLNVAVAGAILMYEVVRQRRGGH